MELILASGSPRRSELLRQIGLTFSVHPADVDETLDPDWIPAEAVERLSARKAEAVAQRFPDQLILAADTVVSLEGDIMGKPLSPRSAFAMLSALSGRTHEVFTGLTLRQGDQVVTVSERTAVTFRPLTSEEISAYIATGEPMDKAGAYGIQGRGALFITGIEGDYFNVMGLPLCRLSQLLKTDFGRSLF